MDKQTFEKEILNKAQPNYALGILDQVGADRAAVINNLASTVNSIKVREIRVDILYLYSFAAMIRGGVSGVTLAALDDINSRLTHDCSRWYDQTQTLIARVQQTQRTAKDSGIFTASLGFLSRR
jgi:hypothetical protein